MPELILNKALKILALTNAIVLIAGGMIGPIYALFVEEIGGDLLSAGFAGGVFALAAGITTLMAGKYADKIKENELMIVFGYFLMGIGFLLYMFVKSIWSLFLVQALIGFSEAIYAPVFDAIYSKHLDKNKAGRAWGVYESINYFSLAAGAVIGGLVGKQFGFNILFIIMAMLCFWSAIYIYFLPRKVL